MENIKRMAKDIQVGVCDVLFTPEGTSTPIALGLSKGGMAIKYEPKYYELTCDQTGGMPLDDVLIGETITVEGDILDVSAKKIAELMPTASVVGDKENPDAVTFGRNILHIE